MKTPMPALLGAWPRQPGALNLVIEGLGSFAMIAMLFVAHVVALRLAEPSSITFAVIYTLEFGLGYFGLLLLFNPYPRACFNPAVALARAIQGSMGWKEAFTLSLAQIGGAMAAWLILRWSMPALSPIPTVIPEVGVLSELVAVFGTVMIYGALHHRSELTRSVAVALGASLAFWVTGVPLFANTAVCFAWFLGGNGSAWLSVLAAHGAGAISAALLVSWMFQMRPTSKPR